MTSDDTAQFYTCDCFTTDNLFLEDYSLHVRFVSEQQFRLDYEAVSEHQQHIHNSNSVMTWRDVTWRDVTDIQVDYWSAAAEEARLCDGPAVWGCA